MRLMRWLALVVLSAGCGGAPAAERSKQASASVCETLLDAGTVCDPCPGSPHSYQFGDEKWVERVCDCPRRSGYPKTLPDGRIYFGGYAEINWQACPLTPVLDWRFEPTCANARAMWDAFCLAPPLY